MSETHEHSEGPASAHGGHGYTAAEADRANVGVIGLLLAITAIGLAVGSYMLWLYFEREAQTINYQQVLSRPSNDLEMLRAKENTWLGSYGVVDAEKGTYRLPIQQGKQLFLQQSAARRRAGSPQIVGARQAAAGAAGETAPGAGQPAAQPQGQPTP